MPRLNITESDLEDPYRFSEKVPAILERVGLTVDHERLPWEWRALALRAGTRPVGLFVWCMQNWKRAFKVISGEDEREAGLAMQAARKSNP